MLIDEIFNSIDEMEECTGYIKLSKLGVCVAKLSIAQRDDQSMVQAVQVPPVRFSTRNRYSTRGTLEEQFKQSLSGIDRREEAAARDEATKTMSKQQRVAIRASRRRRESRDSSYCMENVDGRRTADDADSGRRTAATSELDPFDNGRRASIGIGEELRKEIFGVSGKRSSRISQESMEGQQLISRGSVGFVLDEPRIVSARGRQGSAIGSQRGKNDEILSTPRLSTTPCRGSATLAPPQNMLEMILGDRKDSAHTPHDPVKEEPHLPDVLSPRKSVGEKSFSASKSPRDSLPLLSPRDMATDLSPRPLMKKTSFVVPNAMVKRTVRDEILETARDHDPYATPFYTTRVGCVPVGCSALGWSDPDPVPPRTPARWKVRGPMRPVRIK